MKNEIIKRATFANKYDFDYESSGPWKPPMSKIVCQTANHLLDYIKKVASQCYRGEKQRKTKGKDMASSFFLSSLDKDLAAFRELMLARVHKHDPKGGVFRRSKDEPPSPCAAFASLLFVPNPDEGPSDPSDVEIICAPQTYAALKKKVLTDCSRSLEETSEKSCAWTRSVVERCALDLEVGFLE